MTNNKVKKTALDRKLDKIRAAEESGKLGTKLTNRTLRKLTSNKLAVIGVLLFVVICVLCFGAPLFTKYAPTALDLRAKMSPPDLKHILGTDQMGRDIWARILYGGRISIIVGLGSALGAALLAGIAVGVYDSIEDTQRVWQKDLEFQPKMEEFDREQLLKGWHRAIERAKNWVEH